MRGLKRFVVAAVVIAACARMAPPPGGPARRIPPVLLGTYPDSGQAPCDFRGAAEFRFDEVTSDAGEPNFGYGTGTLERLIIFSPDSAVPQVEWHRDRITVRPRAGWRNKTTYRIELLPGILDLHQNVSKAGSVLAFTVCGPKPTRTLSGRVIDWISARAVTTGAVIEAMHLPDSARYRAIADSSGRFQISGLPDGPYLVSGAIDTKRSHRRESGQAWDSVRVDATRDTVGEIWAFSRDTLPPKITDVARIDSQSIAVTFAKPIDPALRLDTAFVRVGLLLAKDTVSIGVMEALPKPYSDSIHRVVPVRTPAADSAFRIDSIRKDSIARANPPQVDQNKRPTPAADLPKQKRPALSNVIIIRTRGFVQKDSSYFVGLSNVRTAGGQTGPPVGITLLKAKPLTPAELAKMKADSAKAKTDSIRNDSLKKARGGPSQ